MKHLKKFEEGFSHNKNWSDLDKEDDLKPKGFRSTERPEWSYEKPEVKTGGIEDKVDPYFIQEISDRLYGPDSEEYVRELTELNKKYRPRGGRSGGQFYEPKKA